MHTTHWQQTKYADPDVLDLIQQRYWVRHVIDIYEVGLDLDLYRNAMADLAATTYAADDRSIVLYQDTDYCEPESHIGHSLYNFFKLASELDVPLDKIILVTNHHGLTDTATKLCRDLCNAAAPRIIETVLWFDFPKQAQISSDCDQLPSPARLFVCPNNQHRRHRMFLLTCLSEAGLLSRGLISYNFGHAS